jgi:SAM-dependent methyltransferase
MNKFFSSQHFDEIEKSGSVGDNYFSGVVELFKSYLPEKPLKMLDVGCGTGLFFCDFAELDNIELLGLDSLSEKNEIAVRRGYKNIVDIEDLSSSRFPFRERCFDVVLCKDVLEHLLEPKFALHEIGRVLNTGGLLLIHVPNHFSLFGRVKFLFSNKIDTFDYFGNDHRWTYPHIRFFEHSDFVDTILDTGFEMLDDLSDQFPAIPGANRLSWLRLILSPLVKRFPGQLCAGFTLVLKKV